MATGGAGSGDRPRRRAGHGGANPSSQPTDVQIDLYQDGVATAGSGALFRLPDGMAATYLDGSRVLDPAALTPPGSTRASTPPTGRSAA
ncbi:hypothetical protein NKG05_18605 [Oerskovia sp. M15]